MEAYSHGAIINRVDGAKAERDDFPLKVREILRTTHAGYHVARIDAHKANLLAYAKAGHATATVDNRSDHLFEAVRHYNPPSEKLSDDKEGTLHDEYSFCRWLYAWNDISFVLYLATERSWRGSKIDHVFLLSTAKNETDQLLLAAGKWSSALHDELYVFDDSSWIKDAKLWQSVQASSWDDVILAGEMKSSLINDVVGFFDTREVYQNLHLPWKRGIILHGVPGCGKTITIKALIKTLHARSTPIPSLYVKAFDGCRGQKWSIQAIFTHARLMAPCLLIFEDLDSLVDDKVRSYFLNEVDGLESNDGILIVGSTNHLARLDPAIAKRPSRFDRKYHFRLPDEATRTAYARYWKEKLADKPSAGDFSDSICPLIAQMTEGFSFAYLCELFISSLLALIRGVGVQEDGGVSTPPVMVEKPGLTTADADSKERKEGGQGSKADSAKKTREFPSVEIPEPLAGNLFLRIIHAQAKLLYDQMGEGEDGDDDQGSKLKTRQQPPAGNTSRAC